MNRIAGTHAKTVWYSTGLEPSSGVGPVTHLPKAVPVGELTISLL